MNITELRERVLELLGDYVGTYTLDEGSTQPAVWVGGRVSTLVTDVTGLEILISATPELNSNPIFGGDKVLRRTYKIRLVQHTSNQPMDEELMLLIQGLHIDDGPVVQDETDQAPQQATMYIVDHMVVYPQVTNP